LTGIVKEPQKADRQQAHGEPERLITLPGNTRGKGAGIVGCRPGQADCERAG